MALRSQIGSSLVAKANPASPIRKTEQNKIENPAVPGKGATGSLTRQFIEQPFLRPIPEGSARTVSVNPNVEAGAISSPTSQVPDVSAGVSQPAGQPQLRSGADSQALFQGGVSTPASTGGRAGVTAKARSVAGGSRGAIQPQGQITPEAASTYKAPGVRSAAGSINLPTTFSNLGGKVAAGEFAGYPTMTQEQRAEFDKQEAARPTATTLQQVRGTFGNIIDKVGKRLGNPLPERGVSERAQAFGGSATVAAAGKASASNALRSIVQKISNLFNKLRSSGKR